MEPNTKIPIGKLTENHLEKISKAYKELGLEICGQSLLDHIGPRSVNEQNKKIRDFEITPQPFGQVDNKLVIECRYSNDEMLYVHTMIFPNENNIKNSSELIFPFNNENLINKII